MKITVETIVSSDLEKVWKCWNEPEDIISWNAASDDWHTTSCEVDLQVGGKFNSRMEAKDESMGFDFSGTYLEIIPHKLIQYSLNDGRKVSIEFAADECGVKILETFDADSAHDTEHQRAGWQSILNNFARYVESKGKVD